MVSLHSILTTVTTCYDPGGASLKPCMTLAADCGPVSVIEKKDSWFKLRHNATQNATPTPVNEFCDLALDSISRPLWVQIAPPLDSHMIPILSIMEASTVAKGWDVFSLMLG